jgi:hypothetical protein
MKILPWVVLYFAIMSQPPCRAQLYETAILESFQDPHRFESIARSEGGPIFLDFSENRLEIRSEAAAQLTGVYHIREVSGNFYAETAFENDDAVGLVLIAAKGGKPDYDNYTLISVNTRDGVVYVNQYDRIHGVDNVHDPRLVVEPSRYQARLDGSVFSVPFTGTNKKIRILHESLSNTFHFYYGTRLEKWGMVSDDWLEVAPQYAWLDPDQSYFVGLICRNESPGEQESAVYRYLRVVNTPVDDTDDRNTGFEAVRRPYSWSGFDGVATVVTFGEDFAFDRNIKFVVWDRANNAPAWRLNNQHLLNFEFFECGDSVFAGCHEAMSDRQRHGQTVEILENNAVRKIVHWKGIPLNPNYNYSGEHLDASGLLPYFHEIWTFYPDGTGTRQLIDYPKLDVPHRRQWGPEIIEPMPIGGSLVEAGDLCNAPALSVFNLTDSVKTYFPPPARNENAVDSWNWPQIVYDCHFRDGLPDFYMVYNQSEEYPGTWTGLEIETQISWHHTGYNFSHWPVGREPYGQNTRGWGAESRSYASHPNEVTHTSLVSAGFYRKGLDFTAHYSRDSTGRPCRKHVMLAGVSRPYDYEWVRDNVQTWLNPGAITLKGRASAFIRNDTDTRCLVIDHAGRKPKVVFALEPAGREVRNPAIRVLGWPATEQIAVTVDGKNPEFKSAKEGDTLLVWIKTSFGQKSVIRITPK